MKRPASLAAAAFLILVAIAQCLRVAFGVSIVASGIEIPLWPSVIAALSLASLATWLLKERNSA